MKIITLITLVSSLLFVGYTYAEEFSVGQKDRKFSTKKLTIAVGDKVSFTNEDPFSHNVYSLSDAASFDLGSYPRGQSRDVTFKKAGVVEVRCAIHLDMAMQILVK